MAALNGKTAFSGKADVYARCRPSYPAELVDWLYTHANAETVADIGAGTGIFTACLLKKPWQVIAVEPNPDMRKVFAETLPGIRCLPGSGEATGLPDHSMDLITAAQAFHWMDEQRFREECRRILRQDGQAAILWNHRTAHGIAPAYEEVSRKYCPNFRTGHTGSRSEKEGDRFLRGEYFREAEVRQYRHFFPMNEDQFIGNALSRSYSLTPDHPLFTDYIGELRDVFQRFAVNGIVQEEYETMLYLGRF